MLDSGRVEGEDHIPKQKMCSILMYSRIGDNTLEQHLKNEFLWGYPELYKEFNLRLRPVLALLREEKEAERARRRAEEEHSPERNSESPRSQWRSENQNEHGSVSGLPHGSMVNISVPEGGSAAVEAGQPGTEPEFRRQPDDEASPSDEYSPSAAITGGPELVDSTASGPTRNREPEMPRREDDAITRNDRLAEEEKNKESPAAVEGQSSE